MPGPPDQKQRASDDRLIEWLRLRKAGMTCRDIAARYCVPVGSVNGTTHKVYAADMAESGEPPARVRAAYWIKD